jgi:hypothetical protein
VVNFAKLPELLRGTNDEREPCLLLFPVFTASLDAFLICASFRCFRQLAVVVCDRDVAVSHVGIGLVACSFQRLGRAVPVPPRGTPVTQFFFRPRPPDGLAHALMRLPAGRHQDRPVCLSSLEIFWIFKTCSHASD